MLDFAIFAVTFLLALVGAVLYLYPPQKMLLKTKKLMDEQSSTKQGGGFVEKVVKQQNNGKHITDIDRTP